MKRRIFNYRDRFFASVVLVILGLALSTWVANADIAPSTYSFYTGTDTKVIPSAPPLGPANSVLIDPTFGSHILRVTDQNTKNGQSFISTDSGFQRSFNADSTAIKLTGPHGDSYWMEFNSSTFKVGNGSSQPVPHPLSFDANWEWSAVDPDIIYFLNGNQIAKYNKSTGVTTNLGGPSTGEPVTYAAAVIGQDNWVCAAAGSGYQDSYTKIFCINPANTSSSQFIDVYNKTINGFTATNLTNWPTSASGQVIGIHGLSGGTGLRWLYASFHQQSWGANGDAVYNLETQKWSLVTTADPYWGGHASMGNGKFANASGSKDGHDSRGMILRDPDDLMNPAAERFIAQPSNSPNGWCDSEHNSWLNSAGNANAPILESRYTPLPPCTQAWTGEITLAAVDGSNTVWRIAHNHGAIGSVCFYGQAFAQISGDGKWAIFSSYWDGTLGPDTAFGCNTRIDTFIIDLTGSSAADSSPAPSSTAPSTTTPVTTTPAPTTTSNSPSSTTSTSGTPAASSGTTSNPGPTTRIEETDPAVTYTGNWYRLPSTGTSSVYSGGTAQGSMDAPALATLRFNGTAVTFIAYCDQWSGIAQIYVDGSPTTTVDLYASPAQYSAKLYTVSGLTPGAHTVGFGPTGRKNASSQGLWVVIDAFDVVPGSTTSTTNTGTATPAPAPTVSTPAPAPTVSTPTPVPTTGTTTSTTPGSTAASATPVYPRGGQSLTTIASVPMQVGSAEVVPGAQSVPSGLAIFAYRKDGVLVSEAGVPGAAPASRGRIYVDVSGVVNTGLAIANENDSAATVSFFFTDGNGTDFGNGSITIPAHGQISKFLDEAPFNAPHPSNGTFTFRSNVPVSAIAIRGLTNERSEFLVTTLPVANPDTSLYDTVYFSHFAYGGGWTTQFVLVNPSDTTLTGTLSFSDQGAAGGAASSLTMNVEGALVNQVSYSIPPRSSKRYSTVSVSSLITMGSAQVTPSVFHPAPVGVAIFSFKNAGITVSEAGIPTMSLGSAFRMYAEADQTNAIQTGVALRNAGSANTAVTFELTNFAGTSIGLSGSLVIPAFGQRSLFLNQIPGFQSLPMPFQGVLRISTAAANITVLGIRGRWNERGDFIFTTSPATNESAPAHSALVFPHFANGGGYTTQFITFSGTPAEPTSGNLQLFSQSGEILNIGIVQR